VLGVWQPFIEGRITIIKNVFDRTADRLDNRT
jgi:hypothetical protein